MKGTKKRREGPEDERTKEKLPVEYERDFLRVIHNTASGDSCSLYLK